MNMYRANGSLCWHDNQQVSFDLSADYNTIGSTFMCEFSGSVVSTVHDIASLSVSVKHRHNATKVDSNLKITVSATGFLRTSVGSGFLKL